MNSPFVVAGLAAVLTAGVVTLPSSTARPAPPSQVVVHCPAGGVDAFVTPQQVHVAVGDTVEWRMTGNVVSDTLTISLKDSTRTWPFSGARPAGRTNAHSGRASTVGTYSYNVHLLCRQPGGGTRPVVIDPDIIIE